MIEVQGLGFRYGKIWIFRDISFSLPAGKIAAILALTVREKQHF